MNFRVESNIGLGKPINFLVLAAGWFLSISVFNTIPMAPRFFTAWILLASALSMVFLSAIGYFDHHIPKPEISGVLSLLLVLPLSAIVSKWALLVATHVPIIRYGEAFKASLLVALFFEFSQVLVFKVHRFIGRKWSLATYLQPAELAALRAQIEKSGAAEWITIHPCIPHDNNGASPRKDETVVISRSSTRDLNKCIELLSAHLRGQRIVDVRQLMKELNGRVNLNSDGWTFLMGSTYQSFSLRFYFYVKEVLEVILAVVLLVLLSPLLIGLAVCVYISKGYPVFYRQERLGYRGKRFFLYKFRTMLLTAESNGPQWAQEDDPRITPFGKWLRKTRLDELPQLLNVIRGDLSFVGPRPERPEFYKLLSEQIPLFPMRLLVRPGITGWAQVKNGYAGSVDESKMKLEYDLYYVQHMSPRLDLHVAISTAALMLRGQSGR